MKLDIEELMCRCCGMAIGYGCISGGIRRIGGCMRIWRQGVHRLRKAARDKACLVLCPQRHALSCAGKSMPCLVQAKAALPGAGMGCRGRMRAWVLFFMKMVSFPFFGVVVDVVLYPAKVEVGAEDAVVKAFHPFHVVAQAVCMFAYSRFVASDDG